jgi:acetyltransferase-like isoleucine patch superfamily enzyme
MGEQREGGRDESDLSLRECQVTSLNIAIAASDVRQRIALECEAGGAQPFSIIASTVIIHDDVEIGPGAGLRPFVIWQSNSSIGTYFHAYSYSSVAHDCIVGDDVTLGHEQHVMGLVATTPVTAKQGG